MKNILIGILVLSVLYIPQGAFAETAAERRERLETELAQVEKQIQTQQQLVEGKRSERQSLERDIGVIEGEIQQAQLGIQARSVAIEQLSDQIGEKGVVLSILEEKSERQQESLADLVRKSALIEDYSLVEVMLSKESFSEFFTDVAIFQNIKESLNESLAIMHGIKRDTIEQRNQLENKQETEAEMKRIQELEKREIEQKEQQKEQILSEREVKRRCISSCAKLTKE